MWVKVASSWLAVLAGALFFIKLYSPKLFDKLTGNVFAQVQQPAATAEPTTPKRPKSKRTLANRVEAANGGTSTPSLSATEGKANKKRKIISAPVENKVVAHTTEGQKATLPRDKDDGMNNKEFAQELARAQAGTKLEAAKSQGPTKKERRAAAKATQSKPNAVEASGQSTEASSTTGRDADDDLSPVGSPSSGPVSTAPTSRAGDVSDMLEAPTAKPGVLRLTDIKDTGSKPATKSSQAFQPALTKKQRQRQAKAAEQKALREESDRLHEQKKQTQLRTARTVEGTSNQTKANNFTFTTQQNAWQSSKPASEKLAQNVSTNGIVPLLDTFEREETTTPTINSIVATGNINELNEKASETKRVSRPSLDSKPSWADEVNQEEQDKWANELAQEEKWEAVTSKKGKKKGKRENGETSSEASSSIARPVLAEKPLINGNHANGVKKPRAETSNRFQSIEVIADPGFKDAEWEA